MDHYPLGFYKKSGSGPTESMGVLMGEWNALFAFSAVTLFACKSFKQQPGIHLVENVDYKCHVSVAGSFISLVL